MTSVSDELLIMQQGPNPSVPENTAFVIIRVSRADQLRGYGPDAQWQDDVLPNAAYLGLQVDPKYRRIIQEPATGWDRHKYEATVSEAIRLHQAGEIDALLFPRVDRETRNLLVSIPILSNLLRNGLKVFFARERLQLDPNDGESLSRYVIKAEESRAYVETFRINSMQGRRRRMERDKMMPTGKDRWAHKYHPYRRDWGHPPDAHSGRYTADPERISVVQAWVRWILEEGASLSECQRRTKDRFGIEVGRSALSKTLGDPIIIGKVYAYRSRRENTPRGTRNVRLPDSEWTLVYEDPELAIITEEQFQALRVKFQRNKENSPRNIKHWYPPIRGMVFCSSCNRKMSGQFRGRRQAGFRCAPCHRWVKAVPLWEEIQGKIREIVLQPELVASALKSNLDNGEAINGLESEIQEIGTKLTTLRRAEQKLLRLHLYIDDDDERDAESEELLLAEQERIHSQRRELRRRETELQAHVANLRVAVVDADGIRRFLFNASTNLDSWDEARWKILLEALNLKVVAYNDRIDVGISVPSQEGEGVTVSPTPQCGPRPTRAGNGSIGSIELPAAWRTAHRQAALSSA